MKTSIFMTLFLVAVPACARAATDSWRHPFQKDPNTLVLIHFDPDAANPARYFRGCVDSNSNYLFYISPQNVGGAGSIVSASQAGRDPNFGTVLDLWPNPDFSTGMLGAISSNKIQSCTLESESTVECWIKLRNYPSGTASRERAYIVESDRGRNWGLYITPAGHLSYTFGDAAGASTYYCVPGPPVTVNEWHHVAVTRKITSSGPVFFNVEVFLLLDGQCRAGAIIPNMGRIRYATAELAIGAEIVTARARPLEGQIDELRISNCIRYHASTVPLRVYKGEFLKLPRLSDINEDCYTDLADLAVLTSGWMNGYDMYDFAQIAKDWLSCYNMLDSQCGN